MKYQFRMYYADALNQTAGSKATRDCSAIMNEMGYGMFDVPVHSNKHRLFNLLTLLKAFGRLYFLLRAGDVVLIQYPVLGINKWLKYFVRLLASRSCRLVCLLHDLDGLRHVHHTWTLEGEVARLNAFDLLIVHNERMRRLLQKKGLKAEMRCLGLFDYLCTETTYTKEQPSSGESEKLPATEEWSSAAQESVRHIAFAGNLGKSVFLKKLDPLPGIKFVLYGPGYECLQETGLEWEGMFDADALPAKLKADFGLIWDGDDVDGCTGYLGKYLRYNNPHKASLYLLAGLPIIAPRNSAIGAFIQKHGVGITIDGLQDLPKALSEMEASEYQRMKAAIWPISRKLASGAFLRQALAEI
jgi:hypothetical protein